MIALDANILIALLDPHNTHHSPATRFLMDTGSQPLIVHPMTMAEVLVGGARMGRETQMDSALRALGLQLVPYDDQEPIRLARLRTSTRLKLPDCCVLDIAITHGAILATFDQALAAAAAAHGVAVAP